MERSKMLKFHPKVNNFARNTIKGKCNIHGKITAKYDEHSKEL